MLKRFFSPAKPALPDGQRVYAIGDVHGRLDLLDALLATIELDNAGRAAADVTLVLLGDLIDRGPDSRGVVARVRDGVRWARTVAVMGNHEAIMLAALDGDRDLLTSWLRFGGRETLASWGVGAALLADGTLAQIEAAARAVVPATDRDWLASMRPDWHVGDYYFVHAGIKPGVPIEAQRDEDRLWIREEFLTSRRDHGVVVVHGHSISAEAELRPNRIGLDTGAYASGRLTALGLEGEQRWLLST